MSFANEASWDRIGRVFLGIVLLYLGWAEVVTGGWGIALKIIGFVLVAWVPVAVMSIRQVGHSSAAQMSTDCVFTCSLNPLSTFQQKARMTLFCKCTVN